MNHGESGKVADVVRVIDAIWEICRHRNRDKERIDIRGMIELEVDVVLVLATTGIIDNGGFEYLFSGRIDGDPSYVRSAAAFKNVGLVSEYEAFQSAFALFPGNVPPSDTEVRMELYYMAPKAVRSQVDRRFSKSFLEDGGVGQEAVLEQYAWRTILAMKEDDFRE